MNKKTLAYIIQGSLLTAIIVIGFITYKAVERDYKPLDTKISAINKPGKCPPSQKRSCTMESYTTKPATCGILPDECNSQNDSNFCFLYSWKSNQPVGDCRNCSGVDLEGASNRTFTECNGNPSN